MTSTKVRKSLTANSSKSFLLLFSSQLLINCLQKGISPTEKLALIFGGKTELQKQKLTCESHKIVTCYK